MLFTRFISSVLVLRVANIYSSASSSIMSTSGVQCKGKRTKFLSQAEAGALDQELFNDYKFSVDQLMELAGLSVASAIAKAYPHCTYKTALIVCGPGNNGGDGLVAARHMTLFGYKVAVYYPKRTPKPLYENLLEQCKRFGVNILEELPLTSDVNNEYKLLVDALFGFSFKPPVRDELKPVLDLLINSTLPVCSVDIPSGWDVEKGPIAPNSIKPAMLISLSAPKMCARQEILLDAKHYLGGRFLPPGILEKYNLTLPEYPNQDVDIPSGWDVEKGPIAPNSIKPAMLISLSAPKMCARQEILLDAKHYLGGRFLPPGILEKYNLTLPEYPNQEQVVQLSC